MNSRSLVVFRRELKSYFLSPIAYVFGVLFLTVLSVLLYLTNKRLWAPVKARYKKK